VEKCAVACGKRIVNIPPRSKKAITYQLLPDGPFDHRTIAEKFLEQSREMDPFIAEFVYGKLLEYHKNK